MKIEQIAIVFPLFVIAGVFFSIPAFADHQTAIVSAPQGSGVPGCEDTAEGCFIPMTVTVDVGGEVTWSNDDTAAHTVTSGTAGDGPDGFFDSGMFVAGNTFSIKFDDFDAGDYPYFCIVHPWMKGTVIVQEAQAEEELEEGELIVAIETTPENAGKTMEITLTFTDMGGNSVEHVNYNIMATQGTETILDDTGVYDPDGVMTHTTMALPVAASDEMPVDVSVEFLGFGVNEPFTGPVGQVETAQVVPEFGTIAMVILGVSIVTIIAFSTKSKAIMKL